jgi:hypothetical protein
MKTALIAAVITMAVLYGTLFVGIVLVRLARGPTCNIMARVLRHLQLSKGATS